MTIEESIRHIYQRVELGTIGTASNELHVLADDSKIIVIARGAAAGSRMPANYTQTLLSEMAAELGIPSVTLRTGVSLAEDEKMEIFSIER